MKPSCAKFIEEEFRACVKNTIIRIGGKDTYRPFHEALLSKPALFWSRFERSFSTSFGQRVIEQISREAALSGGADIAQNQRATSVTLSLSQLNAIEDHIVSLRDRSSGKTAQWDADVKELTAIKPAGEIQKLRVISDLWWQKNGIDHFMSIKTVKPNIDQTAEAKRDLLKLKLAYPQSQVYYGLYYNPYGESRKNYNWSPPMRIFNFYSDRCVLIGKDYWDTLGGEGFYEEILAIAKKVGLQTRAQLGKLA